MNQEKICRVGVIGFGLRGEYMVRNFAQFNMTAQLVAIVDPNQEAALARLDTIHIPHDTVTFYPTVAEMMSQANLDGVMICTPCDSHTELACEVMAYGLPLFLEKPVVISQRQWETLAAAEAFHHPNVLVSFPLRAAPLCQKAKEILDAGTLGDISQVQMVNNVTYGGVYYHSWFRDESLTGGLFLQKSTHDIDVLHYLLEQVPTTISAMESKVIFRGDKPAGTTCPTCDDYRTCPESSNQIKNTYYQNVDGEGCAFAQDTGNHDSATILMGFPNGVHAYYAQNFVARKGAAQRSVRVIGYKATLEFDFVTEKLQVFHHHNGLVESITVDSGGLNHFGGDKVLAENFVAMMEGREDSLAPLFWGLESAKSCLMAKQSAEEHIFVTR